MNTYTFTFTKDEGRSVDISFPSDWVFADGYKCPFRQSDTLFSVHRYKEEYNGIDGIYIKLNDTHRNMRLYRLGDIVVTVIKNVMVHNVPLVPLCEINQEYMCSAGKDRYVKHSKMFNGEIKTIAIYRPFVFTTTSPALNINCAIVDFTNRYNENRPINQYAIEAVEIEELSKWSAKDLIVSVGNYAEEYESRREEIMNMHKDYL